MSKSLSEKLSVVVVVSFVAFLAFTYCTAQATETKYLFYGFDLAVVAATNQSVSFSDEVGAPIVCAVYSRNVPTKEPPKASPVIVTLANHDDSDLPFFISCLMELSVPTTIKCAPNEAVAINGECRPVGE